MYTQPSKEKSRNPQLIKIMNVLFICKGNINRSALAEYILKQQLQDLPEVCIRSSGTTAAFGSWGAKATKKMRDLAAARGVQNDHTRVD